jgi:enoyl-CoA hydratase
MVFRRSRPPSWRPALFSRAEAVHQQAMPELSFEGEVARLRLVRPEARNAIRRADWKRIAALVDEAAARRARLLLLCGDAKAFSAGADITEFPALLDDSAARTAFRLAMREGIEAVADAPMPTAALIEGPCYGAAVALVMASDLRVAGPGAAFAITPAKFGISYPQEDVHRLVSLVGQGQAARLLLTARGIDAAEAARIGLVDILAEDCRAEAEAIAQAIVAGSAASQAELRRAIRLAAHGVRSDPEQDRRFEALFGSDDLAARLPRR